VSPAIGERAVGSTVPMHYDTLEKIRQNPHAFAESAATAGHKVRVMGAGETIEV
jgi:L-ascorbate metabolism protein UlaG (beta-lactamase superfamily)